jgi:hypothetical protein
MTQPPPSVSAFAASAVTMDYVTTAIVMTTLALLGIGIVVNGLLRLKRWLNNPPPSAPPGGDAAAPPEQD